MGSSAAPIILALRNIKMHYPIQKLNSVLLIPKLLPMNSLSFAVGQGSLALLALSVSSGTNGGYENSGHIQARLYPFKPVFTYQNKDS